MARINVRGLNETVVHKLNDMARKKNVSREALVRGILEKAVLEEKLRTTEDKYVTLVNVMTEVVQNNNEELAEMLSILEEIRQTIRSAYEKTI